MLLLAPYGRSAATSDSLLHYNKFLITVNIVLNLKGTVQTYRQMEHAEKDQISNKGSNSNDYINDRGFCT